jgi:hypothetical protein
MAALPPAVASASKPQAGSYRLIQHIQVADWIVTAGLLIGFLKYKLNVDFYFPSGLL